MVLAIALEPFAGIHSRAIRKNASRFVNANPFPKRSYREQPIPTPHVVILSPDLSGRRISTDAAPKN